VTERGRPIRAAALVRLLIALAVVSYLIAAGALVALCALAVLAVLEWADAMPRPGAEDRRRAD
jgi:hypothetical protein